MLSIRNFKTDLRIPSTAVGGLFRSFPRDLKYPPTTVGGITRLLQEMFVETI
jgi:hypothetical protein